MARPARLAQAKPGILLPWNRRKIILLLLPAVPFVPLVPRATRIFVLPRSRPNPLRPIRRNQSQPNRSHRGTHPVPPTPRRRKPRSRQFGAVRNRMKQNFLGRGFKRLDQGIAPRRFETASSAARISEDVFFQLTSGNTVCNASSKTRSQASLLPLLHRMEKTAGEKRRVLLGNSPLVNPLPARFSRGEEGAAQGFESTAQVCCFREPRVAVTAATGSG